MLLIVKLPQQQVTTAVETQGVTAAIGPTSARGWTTLWSEELDESDLAGWDAGYLAICETPDGLQMDVFLGAGVALRQLWPYTLEAPAVQGDALAAGLTALFDCPDRQQDLEELLRGAPVDADELVESLDPMLDLPELYDPAPAVAVVAYRGAHKIARFAASLAGPAIVCAGPAGWTILQASGEDESRSNELAAGLSAGAGRRGLVLLAWRDGTGSGWSLWRRGMQVADWSWNARWRLVESDPLGAEAQTVRRLVKALGHPVDENSLRALLRSRRADHDPLAEFVALLGLPSDLLVSLDNPGRFREGPGIEHIERIAVRQAVLQGARGDFDADAPPRWRALSRAYTIGIVVSAGVSVAMTILGIAVLVTDGAVVDQSGLSRDDWAASALFAVLSLVLVTAAVARMRRVRLRRGT